MRAGLGRSKAAAVVAVVVLGVAALGAAGCGSDSASLPEGAAAQVGDIAITQAALDRQIEQAVASFESQGQTVPADDTDEYRQLVQSSMQTLVQQRIIAAEARECGEPCKVERDEVTEELQSIIQSEFGGSQQDFNTFLDQRKLTRPDARAIVLNSLQQQRLFDHVTRGVRFSEEDAKAYYEENKEQFTTPAGRSASHILVETKAEADAIRARLTPANFASIARNQSTDTGSAPQGGDLGVIQRGQLVPEFEKVAFELGDGEISDPVETQFGWHLITISLVPESTTSFEEAKDGIIQSQLQQKRQETYSAWAEETIAGWESRTVYARDELKPPDPDETEGVEGEEDIDIEDVEVEDVEVEDVEVE